MALLFFSQFILTRIFNKAMDDDYHWGEPFSAFHNGRSYTLRSVPEDIWKAVTQTARFISGRESPALRTGVQLLTGRNYRGERTDAVDTLREAAAGAIPISLRDLPGLHNISPTQRNSTITAFEQILGACGVHVGRDSPEFDVYRMADKFKKAQGIREDTGVYPVSRFQPLKYALEDKNMDRAAKEWKTLTKEEDPQKVARAFRASLFHPFTKTAAMDEQFGQSLAGKDRETFHKAVESRKESLARFVKLTGINASAPELSPRARALASLAQKRGNPGLARSLVGTGAVPASDIRRPKREPAAFSGF